MKRGATMVKRQRAPRVRRTQGALLKARSGGRGRGSRKTLSSTDVYGVPVPERLHEAIEIERDNLSKAESILACMVVAMEYETESLTGPYYPSVAQTAREILARSINGLDSVILKRRLLNKIEDEWYGPFVDGVPAPSRIEQVWLQTVEAPG
jgi:hypothetical protein